MTTKAWFAPLTEGDITAIQSIVDRLHVGKSNRAAIAYVASRLRGGRRAFLTLPRDKRKALMRAVKYCHGKNFALYCYVQGGR